MFSINVGFIINWVIAGGKAHTARGNVGPRGEKEDEKQAGQVWLVWITLQGRGRVVRGLLWGRV